MADYATVSGRGNPEKLPWRWRSAVFKSGYGPPTSNDAIALLRLAAEKGDVDNEYKLAHFLEQSGNYQAQSPGIAKPPKKIIRTPKMP
jgi:hypothetical protein